jgi:hypothetical protein
LSLYEYSNLLACSLPPALAITCAVSQHNAESAS